MRRKDRGRRPSQDELNRIIGLHDDNPRQTIALGRIVKFAIATAMRQEEICTLLWSDIDFTSQLAVVRNRKDPRRKSGNHQKVPLLAVTYLRGKAWARAARHEPKPASLISFELGTGDQVQVRRTSLRAVIAGHPVLAPFAAIPNKENGVDIEGLAVRLR